VPTDGKEIGKRVIAAKKGEMSFLSVDKNIQKYIGHRLHSVNSNNNIIIIVHAWFRERDHKKEH